MAPLRPSRLLFIAGRIVLGLAIVSPVGEAAPGVGRGPALAPMDRVLLSKSLGDAFSEVTGVYGSGGVGSVQDCEPGHCRVADVTFVDLRHEVGPGREPALRRVVEAWNRRVGSETQDQRPVWFRWNGVRSATGTCPEVAHLAAARADQRVPASAQGGLPDAVDRCRSLLEIEDGFVVFVAHETAGSFGKAGPAKSDRGFAVLDASELWGGRRAWDGRDAIERAGCQLLGLKDCSSGSK